MSEADRDSQAGAMTKLELLGDADAELCEGEFCEIPPHHEQAVMNRRVDSDQI